MFWYRLRKILLYFSISIFTIFIALIALAFVYQNKIKQIAINEINKNLNGEFILKGDISFSFIKHFPNASVSFHQIILRDKIKNHQTFIEADEFDAGFNTIKIFKGVYTLDALYLKNTKLNVVNYKDGSNNYNVFKSNSQNKSTSTDVEIKKIIISNSTILFQNEKSKLYCEILLRKFIGYGEYINKIINVDYDIEALISKNSESIPTFLFNKSIEVNGKSVIDIKNYEYKLPYVGLTLAENEIELSGDLKLNNLLTLSFKGKDFDVKNLTEFLDNETQKRLKGTEGKGLLDNFNGQLNYDFKKSKFSVKGDFNCDDGTLQIANWNNKFTNISCLASFTFKENIFDFELKKFKANFQNSAFSLSTHYQFANGEQSITSMISGNLNLKNLIDLYPVSQIENMNGNIKLDSLQVTMKFNNKSNINYLLLNNSIVIEQLELKTKNGYSIQKLNAIINAVDDDQLIIKNGIGIINDNEIEFSGNASYQNFMHDFKKYVILKFNSDNLNINSLLVANNENKNDSSTSNNWLDFPLLVQFNCKNANWNKFKMKNVFAEVDINDNAIKIEQFKTETQNGSLFLKGNLIQLDKEILFNINSEYKNLNITSTFEQFDNFNQTMILSDNINGSLTGKTNATGKFDKQFNVIPKSISSTSDIAITNGELKNLSQLSSLSKYLNVDDLKHLKFATLKNQIEIGNGKIIIPEMRIQNNALNINVSGTHTFDNEMDYLLKINLMDWFGKKLGKNTDDDWEEENNKKGFNIFLRMTGKGSDLKISRDKKSSREKFKENLKAEQESLKYLFKLEINGDSKKEKPIDFKQEDKIELIDWNDSLK